MNRFLSVGILGAVLLGGGAATALQAETGQDAWLRYAPLDKVARAKYQALPTALVVPETRSYSPRRVTKWSAVSWE